MSGTELSCEGAAPGAGGGDRKHHVLGSQASPGPDSSSITGHVGPLPCGPRRLGKVCRREQMLILEKYDYLQQELGVVLAIAVLRCWARDKVG